LANQRSAFNIFCIYSKEIRPSQKRFCKVEIASFPVRVKPRPFEEKAFLTVCVAWIGCCLANQTLKRGSKLHSFTSEFWSRFWPTAVLTLFSSTSANCLHPPTTAAGEQR